MMSPTVAGSGLDFGIAIALVCATFAWDGLVRRHILVDSFTIGRLDVRGWVALGVGVLALLTTVGALALIVSQWQSLVTACQTAHSCTVQTMILPAMLANGMVVIPLGGIAWVAFWLWRVRGSDGHLRQWIGPGAYMDEREMVAQVQRALAHADQPAVDGDRIIQIAHALKLRLAPIAFKRNSPFVEDGNLVVHRFVNSLVNSAFANRFHVSKAQMQIVLTEITEYYVKLSGQARRRRGLRRADNAT